MKKIKVTEQVKMIGVKNFKGEEKLIDYYIVVPGQERMYAFSKIYTHTTYDMCKAGVRINQLLSKKSRDTGVMRLVKYLHVMMPYLTEYYDLPVVA